RTKKCRTVNDEVFPTFNRSFGFRYSDFLRPSSFGFRAYLGRSAIRPATIKIFTSAISKKKSQPSRITWSQRKRGSVQRTHMKTKIMTATFAKKTATLMRPKIQPRDPSGIPGKCQPPKNNVTMTADPVIIAAYSPRKYKANFIELYSML